MSAQLRVLVAVGATWALAGLSAGAAMGAVRLDAPSSVSAGTRPQTTALADFNRDGRLDMATVSPFTTSVSISINGGGGKFANPVPYPAGSSPAYVVAADFDADGDPDLAVANGVSPGTVTILPCNGNGTFSQSFTQTTGASTPNVIALGDMNLDGDPDLVVTHGASNKVSIMYGQTGGFSGFFPGGAIDTGSRPSSLVVARLNADTFPDIAVANEFSNNVSVYLTNPMGSINTTPTNFTAGGQPFSLAAADFEGDGDLDLAAADIGPVGHAASDQVSVLLNNGSGSFGAPASYAVGDRPNSVDAGDLDGDGDPDLVVTNSNSGTMTVLQGAAGASFGSPSTIATGGQPSYAALGDVVGDPLPDVVVPDVSSASSRVSVFANTSAPPPAASGLDPSSVPVGSPDTTLTVRGSGFLATSEVLWNGAARPTTVVSASELRTRIAAGDLANAGSATVAVRNPAPGGGTSADLTFTIAIPPNAPSVVVARRFPKLTGIRWHLSRLVSGSVVLKGRLRNAAGASVRVRVLRGKKTLVKSTVAAKARTFTARLRLPGTISVGPLGVRVDEPKAPVGRDAIAPLRFGLNLRAPREGLVGRSWIATRAGGPAKARLAGGVKTLFAHFTLTARPAPGRKLTVRWRVNRFAVTRPATLGGSFADGQISATGGGRIGSGAWTATLLSGSKPIGVAKVLIGNTR